MFITLAEQDYFGFFSASVLAGFSWLGSVDFCPRILDASTCISNVFNLKPVLQVDVCFPFVISRWSCTPFLSLKSVVFFLAIEIATYNDTITSFSGLLL